jgi:predicted  nucleic acid-binding Zn-ribbon protein
MNPDLAKLIELQAAENQIRQVDLALQELPRQRAETDARLVEEREKLAAERERLASAQKSRRQNEAALQDLETRRSKYKNQLMEVKTNKEYQAMLHEIEGVEREIRGVEDRILESMEAAETLTAEIAGEEKVFAEAEARHKEAVRDLDQQTRRLDQERTRLVGERDGVAAGLPEELLARFQRVARLRGVAVAEARDEMCLQCRVVLRPQMFVDLKRNDQIMECPSCSRILHFVPQTPAPADLQP